MVAVVSGNSRTAVLAAMLPAVIILALFVGIMCGATWAIAPVVLGGGEIVVFTATLAYLINLSGRVGIAGGMARIATRRDLVVDRVDEGSVRDAARHEGGHAATIRAVGGHVSEARVFPDGSGYVSGSIPRGGGTRAWVVREVATSLAGGMREGVDPWTAPQCRSDRKMASYHLGLLPGDERDAARAEATALARQTMNGSFANTVERRLLAKGRY